MSAIAEKIENEIAPLTKGLGCEIVKIAMLGGERSKTLQIMIEKIDGSPATIDDCQRIGRALSVKLDVMDIIKCRYNLEVSSAGIDRPLIRFADFVRFCGKPIVVKTHVAKNNCRTFRGRLESTSENGIKVALEPSPSNGEDVVFLLYEEISSAHIDGSKV